MKKSNFTLVELLAVTALIVILAGIGFAAFSYASNRGKEAATTSLIARIGAGLESVKTKHGTFPSSNDAFSDITVTFDAAGTVRNIDFGKGVLGPAPATPVSGRTYLPDALKTFLTVCDGESLKKSLNSSGAVTDGWGGKIKYCYAGRINTVKFDLVAPGPDESFGSAAASTPPTALTGYKSGGEWACDDIANFK